jgi:hypothetical protein
MPSPWRERPINPPSDPKREKDREDREPPKPVPSHYLLHGLPQPPMRRIQGED